MAPDNSYLVWHFDGGHRTMTLFERGLRSKRQLAVNRAPGVEGHEVFHPRWSNHPLFMTMSGPLKIRGGGPEVEVHVGKFDRGRTKVKKWVRVSHNGHADFCPDAWIASGRFFWDVPSPGDDDIRRLAAPSWPVNRKRLAFLWQDKSGCNQRVLPGGATRQFRVMERGLARFGRYGDMKLGEGAFVASAGGDDLLRGCVKSNQLAVELLITPETPTSADTAHIVSFGSKDKGCNFAVGQKGKHLVFAIRTSTSGAKPETVQYSLGALRMGDPNHVVIAYRPGEIACMRGGALTFQDASPKGNLSAWSGQEIVFGRKPDGGGDWPGRLEGIAMYHRFMGLPEAKRNFDVCPGLSKDRRPLKQVVVDAKLLESFQIPGKLDGAYTRALAVNPYEVVRVVSGNLSDKRILAAHWVILDSKELPTAKREKGRVYRMTLERFDEHPEMEGERQIVNPEHALSDLAMYYDVGS
jgi:hypothetical protein